MDNRYLFDDMPEAEPELVPRQKPKLRWDGGHALLYFVFAALLSLITALVLVQFVGFYASIIVSEVLAFVAIPLVARSLFDTGWQTWTGKANVGWAFWLWTLLAVASFGIVQSNLPVLFDRFWPIPKEQFDFYRTHLAAGSISQFAILLVMVAFVPGICEELAFRGLIHTGLRRSFGANHAIIWGGAMFALVHLNPWNFVGLWSFGALLGYLRERTGSVYPGIAAHIVNNSFALLIFSFQRPEDWDAPLEFLPWYAIAPAGALLVYSVWRLHQLTAHTAAMGKPRPPLSPLEVPT